MSERYVPVPSPGLRSGVRAVPAAARAALAPRPVVGGGEHEQAGLRVRVAGGAGGDRGPMARHHLGAVRDRQALGMRADVGGFVHGPHPGTPRPSTAPPWDHPYPSRPMTLADRIREHDLSAGERRVADLILGDPSRLAFGSVATVAADAGVGNSTVMRFATKVGFGGFSDLQAAARDEIEVANVQETFAQLDATVTAAAADALARAAHVTVIAGDAARGVALDLSIQLGMLRGDVDLADVGSIALSRSLAWLGRDDVLVAIDTARYERSVATAVERAAADGARVLAVSDSHVSPIARVATWSFPVVDTGAGPFDSFVAALALTNLLVTLTARRLGRKAVRHIDRLDADWDATGALRPD